MEEIYRTSSVFPKSELFGLTSQMHRAAVSIPANLAEGFMRGHKAEYVQFIRIAYGSGAELETHVEIASRLGYIGDVDKVRIQALLEEVMRMLNGLLSSLITKH